MNQTRTLPIQVHLVERESETTADVTLSLESGEQVRGTAPPTGTPGMATYRRSVTSWRRRGRCPSCLTDSSRSRPRRSAAASTAACT